MKSVGSGFFWGQRGSYDSWTASMEHIQSVLLILITNNPDKCIVDFNQVIIDSHSRRTLGILCNIEASHRPINPRVDYQVPLIDYIIVHTSLHPHIFLPFLFTNVDCKRFLKHWWQTDIHLRFALYFVLWALFTNHDLFAALQWRTWCTEPDSWHGWTTVLVR